MKKYTLILFLFVSLYGCKFNTNNNDTRTSINIKYSTSKIDTIQIGEINTSYVGFSEMNNDNIIFFDKFFGHLYEISLDGNIIQKKMGIGRAANEIPLNSTSAIHNYGENNFVALGGSYDLYLYNDYNSRKLLKINVTGDRNSLESSSAYTSFSEIVRVYDNKLYYNVYSESETSNLVEYSDTYFKNAHVLMCVDLEDGNARAMGGYSKNFQNNHEKFKHLFTTIYDIDNRGNFYISNFADSLIHVFDKDFNEKYSLGVAGDNIDDNYRESSKDWDDFNKSYVEDTTKKGYYYWVKYINETQMLFRSYQKGDNFKNDGLQIYKNNTLIGDIEVPKSFKVIGYSKPYFITSINCDENDKTLKFYRFKLL